MYALALASVLAAMLVVDAQQTNRSTDDSRVLSRALWIDGKAVDRSYQNVLNVRIGNFSLPRVKVGPRDDVLSVATEVLSRVKIAPSSTVGSRQHQLWAAYMENNRLSRLRLDYTVSMINCTSPAPVVYKKEAPIVCNAEAGCPQNLTFTRNTTQYASFGYWIGAAVKTRSEIGVGALRAEVPFFPPVDSSWASTNTTETTETVSRTYRMKKGERCAPTTVQANFECYRQVTLDSAVLRKFLAGNDVIGENFGLNKVGAKKVALKWAFTEWGPWTAPGGDEFWKAISDPELVTFSLGTQGDGSPWVFEGCMFQ